MSTGPAAVAEPVLEVLGLSKHFGATQALQDVDFAVVPGEIHALLGENGSGKSTLVKVLAGVYEPDAGRVIAGGTEVALPMPPGAFREHGLSFVHQDLGLARPLTVLENLVGGAGGGAEESRWRIPWRRRAREARRMLRAYGVDIDPATVVGDLPLVGQALVAIARAAAELERHRQRTGAAASVLVLDEPTVFLPEDEIVFLFELIHRVVASGSSVVFISHDLAAVREVADRVTVLRDGEVVATERMSDVSDDDIVELIAGSVAAAQVGERLRARPRPAAPDRGASGPALSVRGLAGGRVRGIDLDVAPGEIVGIAGLFGSGAEELPYLLFGAQEATAGAVTVAGRDVPLARHEPAYAVQRGIALIPAERQRDAIAPTVSVAENMLLLAIRRFTRNGRLRPAELRAAAADRAERFDVRPRRTGVPIGTLSGGNAQKVVLAKWLELGPLVLLLHQPTQGVDVGARAQIWRTIGEATDAGMAVVWVTGDYDELAAVSDRVVVVSGGVSGAELHAEALSPEAITSAVFAGAAGEPSKETAVS